MKPQWARYLQWAALLVLLGHGVRVSHRVVTNRGLQGDLRIYSAAARAHAAGEDPYDNEALSRAAGRPVRLPFVYPPASLLLLRPLLLLDAPRLHFVFFGLKLLGASALVWIWIRIFFSGPQEALGRACLFLFAALAYQQSLKLDLRAGNVSVFEQLLLWLAALAFLRGRPALYAALVAGAALFKLTAAALLLLPVVGRERRSWSSPLAAATVLALVHWLSWWRRPDLFAHFLRNAGQLDDRGAVNPAALAWIRDAVESFGSSPPRLDLVLYAFLVLCLAGLTWAALRAKDLRDSREDLLVAAFFLYALLMPRFKDYSYILLVAPSAHVVAHRLEAAVPRLLAALLLCTHFFAYQSWVAALALYAVLLWRLRRAPPASDSRAVLKDEPAPPAAPASRPLAPPPASAGR